MLQGFSPLTTPILYPGLYPGRNEGCHKMRLTDLQVKKLVPRDTRFEVSDGKGLCVRITSNGVKTWVFRYRFNRIARRMSFGNYPGISLAYARIKHGEALQDLQRGTDPGLKAMQEKAKMKGAPTFKQRKDKETQHG
jgi:hypothetical protein